MKPIRPIGIVICMAGAGIAMPAPMVAQAQQHGGTCFIQVPKLMAPAPGGIAELRQAIAALEQALKPQVDEVQQLKQEVQRLHQRHEAAMGADSTENLPRLEQDLRAATTRLEERQQHLRGQFATHHAQLVKPVQERLALRADGYAKEQGCTDVKMARPKDMATLQQSGARDITDGFIGWAANNPG